MEAGDVALLRGLGCFWGLCPSPWPQGGAAAPLVSHLLLRPELAGPGDWETLLLGNQVYSSWALWSQTTQAGDGGHVSPVPSPSSFLSIRWAACSRGKAQDQLPRL